MKHIDEFRDGGLARVLASAIAREAQRPRTYNLMEFCGGHTHAIARYGLNDLLPPNVNMIHGPGCPVCVLPIGRIDNAIALAERPGLILCTYADTMRVPASDRSSLLKAKARGADIRMIYSCADVLRIARENPARDVVFFAIGFETTTPPTAVAIVEARALPPRQLQRVLQPRGDAGRDQQHPGIEGRARARYAAHRRLRRPRARVDRHRNPAVRVLRRGVRAAGGHRRASSRST